MATSLDTLIDSTSVKVNGTTISLAGIDEKLRAVALIALLGFVQSKGGTLSGGTCYGAFASGAGGSGAMVRVEITPSAS